MAIILRSPFVMNFLVFSGLKYYWDVVICGLSVMAEGQAIKSVSYVRNYIIYYFHLNHAILYPVCLYTHICFVDFDCSISSDSVVDTLGKVLD